jgi:hypothetical protein
MAVPKEKCSRYKIVSFVTNELREATNPLYGNTYPSKNINFN